MEKFLKRFNSRIVKAKSSLGELKDWLIKNTDRMEKTQEGPPGSNIRVV